jgi:cobalt-zinc-cadmium resistance protein CzcA
VFSSVIVVLVFLPIFTLQGVEGKMFSPMAFTVSSAMLGSVLAALVVIPVLGLYMIRGGGLKETRIVLLLKAVYRPLLKIALRFKYAVVGLAATALVVSLAMVPRLGTEFIPTLEEGSILIGVTMAPSISLEEGTKLIMEMEKEIMQFSAVDEIISRVGRPEAGSHPHPVNYAEVQIELKPMDEWGEYKTKVELIEGLSAALKPFPGVQLNFTQPIQNAFDELLSGIKAQVSSGSKLSSCHKMDGMSFSLFCSAKFILL